MSKAPRRLVFPLTHQSMYACIRSCEQPARQAERVVMTGLPPKNKLQMATLARAAPGKQEPGPEKSLAAGGARKYTRQNPAGEGTSYFGLENHGHQPALTLGNAPSTKYRPRVDRDLHHGGERRLQDRHLQRDRRDADGAASAGRVLSDALTLVLYELLVTAGHDAKPKQTKTWHTVYCPGTK